MPAGLLTLDDGVVSSGEKPHLKTRHMDFVPAPLRKLFRPQGKFGWLNGHGPYRAFIVGGDEDLGITRAHEL